MGVALPVVPLVAAARRELLGLLLDVTLSGPRAPATVLLALTAPCRLAVRPFGADVLVAVVVSRRPAVLEPLVDLATLRAALPPLVLPRLLALLSLPVLPSLLPAASTGGRLPTVPPLALLGALLTLLAALLRELLGLAAPLAALLLGLLSRLLAARAGGLPASLLLARLAVLGRPVVALSRRLDVVVLQVGAGVAVLAPLAVLRSAGG